MAGIIRVKENTIPAEKPPVGSVYLGVDSADNMLYIKDFDGIVSKFPTTGSAGLEDMENVFNGMTLLPFSSDVTSDGTTVSMSFEKAGGGDIKYVFKRHC